MTFSGPRRNGHLLYHGRGERSLEPSRQSGSGEGSKLKRISRRPCRIAGGRCCTRAQVKTASPNDISILVITVFCSKKTLNDDCQIVALQGHARRPQLLRQHWRHLDFVEAHVNLVLNCKKDSQSEISTAKAQPVRFVCVTYFEKSHGVSSVPANWTSK